MKVGLFMSDVVGALDHEGALILIARCEQLGLKGIWLRLLCNILAPRRAAVVVAGVESPIFPIKNSVYQGTVLGPPLWNVCFQTSSIHCEVKWPGSLCFR